MPIGMTGSGTKEEYIGVFYGKDGLFYYDPIQLKAFSGIACRMDGSGLMAGFIISRTPFRYDDSVFWKHIEGTVLYARDVKVNRFASNAIHDAIAYYMAICAMERKADILRLRLPEDSGTARAVCSNPQYSLAGTINLDSYFEIDLRRFIF